MRTLWTLALLACLPAAAQTKLDIARQAKNYEFLQPPFAAPLRMGATLPATCTVNELFFLTSATPGSNICVCFAPNQWAAQGSGGETNGAVRGDGALVGTRTGLNFKAGAGLVTILADTGSQVSVEYAVNTATIPTKASLQSGAALLCESTEAAAGAHECALAPALTGYTRGMVLHWTPSVAVTGAATLNVGALGAKALKRRDGLTDLAVGDAPAGALTPIWYDGAAWRRIQ